MGGYVALALARRAPERITGLLLAGSRAAGDAQERKAFRNELIKAAASRRAARRCDRDRGRVDRRHGGSADCRDDRKVARAFQGPFVVAAGDDDPLLSVDEGARRGRPRAARRLELFPGAGHLVSVEQPEEFNGVLLDFVARAG